ATLACLQQDDRDQDKCVENQKDQEEYEHRRRKIPEGGMRVNLLASLENNRLEMRRSLGSLCLPLRRSCAHDLSPRLRFDRGPADQDAVDFGFVEEGSYVIQFDAASVEDRCVPTRYSAVTEP